jgi:hypothetical protein
VSMLFCVIPAVAGVLSWLALREHIDIGIAIGLVLGALACWLNAKSSGQFGGQERSDPGSGEKRQHDPGRDCRGKHRVEAVHQATVTR